jgi:hypothetical protein
MRVDRQQKKVVKELGIHINKQWEEWEKQNKKLLQGPPLLNRKKAKKFNKLMDQLEAEEILYY